MRYGEGGGARRRQLRYAAVALAVVVLATVLIFFTRHVEGTAAAPATTVAAGGHRAEVGATTLPATSGSAESAPMTSGDDVAVVDGLRRDEAVALIADARRQAEAGNFAEAEVLLTRAEKAVPQLSEIRQARDDVARLKTPEGQFANHIERARLAVDHDDNATAEAELAEAARLKADAPEIAELHATLQAAHDKKVRRETRIAAALARMREAIAKRDFAAANGALNEAERIDVQEPMVRQARGELARAQDAPSKTSE